MTLEHTSIVSFRKAVLSGDWKNAERLLLDGLKYGAARLSGSARVSLAPSDIAIVLRDPHTRGLDVSVVRAGMQQRLTDVLFPSRLSFFFINSGTWSCWKLDRPARHFPYSETALLPSTMVRTGCISYLGE